MWRLTQAPYICFSVVLLDQHSDTISQNTSFYQLEANQPWSFDELSTYPFQTVELGTTEKALPFLDPLIQLDLYSGCSYSCW